MVGVFSGISDYVLLKPLQHQEKILRGQDENEEGKGEDVVSCGSPVGNSISSGEEEELALVVRVDEVEEFLPIEHPVEPPDDDRPAKCPLSDYSIDNDEEDETFADSLRKKLQSSSVDGERHEIRSRKDDAAAAASPSKCSQYNIFHMFQQCKEL